jgi:transposase InsO family protein
MIDPATGWFEMREIPNKEAFTIASLVEQTWLTRYPWPNQVTFDRGKEFMREFARIVKKRLRHKIKPTTTRNPQANSIIERIHQTIQNIICSFQIGQIEIDKQDPWNGVLAAIMFATRATSDSNTISAQLVFGRDAILNIKFDANWELIRERKQRIIN